MVAEGHKRPTVRRHRMVSEIADNHLLQPPPLRGDGLMQAPAQRLLHGLELRPHAVTTALPLKLESAAARPAADEREAQEAEGLRFAKAPPRPVRRRLAAELDQPGLVRMQPQPERLQTPTERLPEAPGLGLVLEADHDVVRVAYEDHGALRRAPSPARGLQVEH